MILLGGQKPLSKIHSHSLDPVLLNPIPFADSVKNLGVIMDKSFSGDLWVKQICRNAVALINRFYRCGGVMVQSTLSFSLSWIMVPFSISNCRQPISVRCSGSKIVAWDSCTACVEESRSGTCTSKIIISCLAFGDSGWCWSSSTKQWWRMEVPNILLKNSNARWTSIVTWQEIDLTCSTPLSRHPEQSRHPSTSRQLIYGTSYQQILIWEPRVSLYRWIRCGGDYGELLGTEQAVVSVWAPDRESIVRSPGCLCCDAAEPHACLLCVCKREYVPTLPP